MVLCCTALLICEKQEGATIIIETMTIDLIRAMVEEVEPTGTMKVTEAEEKAVITHRLKVEIDFIRQHPEMVGVTKVKGNLVLGRVKFTKEGLGGDFGAGFYPTLSEIPPLIHKDPFSFKIILKRSMLYFSRRRRSRSPAEGYNQSRQYKQERSDNDGYSTRRY